MVRHRRREAPPAYRPAPALTGQHHHLFPRPRCLEFFDRPSTGRPAISGKIHDYLPSAAAKTPVRDHCNGLVLLHNDYVVNPATRWAVLLPLCLARGTTTEADFYNRMSLSNSKYQVIKSTIGLGAWIMYQQRYLGKSEKGVYYASVDDGLLSVWILTESSGQMEWVLKLNNLDIRSLYYDSQAHGPWVLQDVNYEYYFPDDKKKAHVEENFEWSSDNDEALNRENRVEEDGLAEIEIIGFHPQKEIIFLSESVKTGYAYHLKSSKIQALRNLYPTRYEDIAFPTEHDIRGSFPHTPCWMRGFPERI